MTTKFLALGLTATLFSSQVLAHNFDFTIENGTRALIQAFYASPVETDDWEEDMLEEFIASGESQTIRFSDDRNVCRYDIRIEFFKNRYDPHEDTVNLCEVTRYRITD